MATDNRVLVTVILHHDQSKNVEEIVEYARKTGFYRDMPPEGTEVVSWVVAMSYGFIIQFLVEPGALRNLNRYMETKAWGAWTYECYPSYDFKAIAEKMKKEHAS